MLGVRDERRVARSGTRSSRGLGAAMAVSSAGGRGAGRGVGGALGIERFDGRILVGGRRVAVVPHRRGGRAQRTVGEGLVGGSARGGARRLLSKHTCMDNERRGLSRGEGCTAPRALSRLKGAQVGLRREPVAHLITTLDGSSTQGAADIGGANGEGAGAGLGSFR